MPNVLARSTLIRTAILLAALTALAVVPVTRSPEPVATWTEVDALVKEQKFTEAAKKVDGILRAAEERKDDAEWTRALIRRVQLETGLHGYETAVRLLKDEPWPPLLLSQTTLDLFYAQSLVQYEQSYSWEIGQREKVETSGPIDLKAWTRGQILAEAEKAYRRAWDRRVELGKLPVGALGEYVDPNNYPKDVRGTLRDAVSYLFAHLLADSSLWTPEQSNGVYRLDLAGLLANEGHGADARLADPTAHPLERLVAVLGDVESWHGEQGRRAAELEARLERLRRLHAAFTEGTDRALIRKDLEERLPRYRDVSWWSMGMADLAGFRQAEDSPDNLLRAREAAIEGAKAYPGSPEGEHAGDIAAAIEAPGYRIAAMSSDAPDRRSIEVTHKNLPNLYFRAYALDLEKRVAASAGSGLLPSGEELRNLVRSGRPAASWTARLPGTPDFKEHATFVTPPMRDRGLWIVAASSREDFAEKNNRITSVAMILGDLVLVTRPENAAAEARTVSGDTGRPVAGAAVTLYAYDWNRGLHRPVETRHSDADGLVRFEAAAGRAERSFFLLARNGADFALDANAFSLRPTAAPTEAAASLVYTDRAIYRPLQKVLWKAVAYRGRRDLGRFRVEPGCTVTVRLRDANNQIVEALTATTNSFGSAAGEFSIPAGRALGAWRIETEPAGSAQIAVEEYKRPTFEVKWEEPKAPLRLNAPATLAGAARYYFGLPVSNGRVRWQVTRQPLYPWWWGWRGPAPAGGAQVIAQGTSALKEDGTFEAAFTASADERGSDAKDLTYSFRATADVTDEGGETRSDARVFRLGVVAIDAVVRMDAGFLLEGAPGAVTVERTDLDGAARAGTGSWRLVALVEPAKALLPAEQTPSAAQAGADAAFATPGDRLRPRWALDESLELTLRRWQDGTEKARGALTHGASGEARVALPPLPAGAWRLRYETVDAFGGVRRVQKDFLVAGRKMPVRLAGVLLAEQPSVGVGGVARLLAFSGLPGQVFFLDILRDGQVASRRVVSAGADGIVEVPVREEDRGGFAASLALVSDHQFVSKTVQVLVPWDDKELRVSFATFRDSVRPGAKETWRVTVQWPPGARADAQAAELLADMYDRSLDAFATPNPPAVLALYPYRAEGGYLRPSLGPANAAWVFGDDFTPRHEAPALIGDRLKFFEGYGIGGPGMRMRGMSVMAKSEARAMDAVAAPVPAAEGSMQSAAVPEEKAPGRGLAPAPDAPQPSLRSDFSETAFWKPQLLTDAEGSAVIEFQVPDSVTSWNVWVHAITRDLKAGSVQRQTRSVKDLMVRPYVPRFLREGDAADLKVVVNNATDRAMSGTVALDILDTETNTSALAAFGLTPEKAKRSFSAALGGSATATFAISAPKRVGSYAFKATAVSGDYSDGELRPVPVLPGRMQLSQSRFVALKEGERRTMAFADMAKTDDTEPHRRAARRHGGRAAVLLRAQRAPVPRELSLRVHRADDEPLRLDRDRVLALPRLSGGGEDGRGNVQARHAARSAGPRRTRRGGWRSKRRRGSRRRRATRIRARGSSTCSILASQRRRARPRSPGCARPRPRSAPSRGGRAARRRRT